MCRLDFGLPYPSARGILTDKNSAPFAPFLSVVNPSNDGHEIVEDSLFNESVLPVEVDGLGIMLAKEVECVHNRVFIAEESEYF